MALTNRLAVVYGNGKEGCSGWMIKAADEGGRTRIELRLRTFIGLSLGD